MADLSKVSLCGKYSKAGKLLIPNNTANPKLSIHQRKQVKGKQSPLYAMLIPEAGQPSYLSGLYARSGHPGEYVMEVGQSYYVATLTTPKVVNNGDGAPRILASQLRISRAVC